MKVETIGEIADRLRPNPARALGARSPRTFHSYLLGYATAVAHHHAAQLIDDTGGRFRAWSNALVLMTTEHEARLNAGSAFGPESIALLDSEDEHCAFETWLDLRERCIRELAPTPTPFEAILGDQTLFALLATIRRRPGMYFGDTRVEYCWALVNGYVDAESVHGAASVDAARISKFQGWVDERYPFGRGRPWYRVFRLLAINTNRGCEMFFRDFDLFLDGDPPDAADPTMTQMVDAIVERSRQEIDDE